MAPFFRQQIEANTNTLVHPCLAQLASTRICQGFHCRSWNHLHEAVLQAFQPHLRQDLDPDAVRSNIVESPARWLSQRDVLLPGLVAGEVADGDGVSAMDIGTLKVSCH